MTEEETFRRTMADYNEKLKQIKNGENKTTNDANVQKIMNMFESNKLLKFQKSKENGEKKENGNFLKMYIFKKRKVAAN